eukprot:jgi/Ulvmu1/5655/UM024_0001.1
MCTPMFAGPQAPGFTSFEDLMASFALNEDYMAEDDEAELVCAGIVDTSQAGTCVQTKQPSSAHSSGESAGPESSVVKRHAWDGVIDAREADADKMAKLRQRNRDAQARHRKRQRERAVDLATRTAELQDRLAAAQEKRQQLIDTKADRSQRLCVALAKLSVTKDIIRTLPAAQTKFTAPPQTVARAASQPHRAFPAAPTVPRALSTFTDFMPIAVEQILQPNTPPGRARVMTEQYKLQEASRVGCSPDEIGWFMQMHFEVSPGCRLSFSTTLSSTSCLASFALNYIATGLQTALFEAMDNSVGELASQLEPTTIFNEEFTKARMQKRSRECFAQSDCPPEPRLLSAPSPASTAAAAATCSDLGAASRNPALTLCCGVNGRCPIDSGVRNVVRNIVAMFCGVVPEGAIADVCTTMVQLGAALRSVFAEPADGGGDGGSDGRGSGSGLGSDEDMLSYFEGVTDSVVAVLAATRDVFDQILNHLPAMVMAAQAAFRADYNEEGACVAALEAQMRHCALTMAMMDSRLFSEAGTIMCRITMIGHVHMLSFCQMESLTALTFKQLQLTTSQKERLWEFWAAWETRKRTLDGNMQVTRATLRALPSSIALPLGFVDHVSNLADGMPRAAAAMLANGMEVVGSVAGLSPEDCAASMKCLRELEAIHTADIDTFKDFKEMQISVLAVLSPRQMGCIWSANIKHKAAPPDFFGICQLAALQMQRESLFALSTYG